VSRPSRKLWKQPSERDQVKALHGKFGTERIGDLQGCYCEHRRTLHQCTPLDVPSNTLPGLQDVAHEPHVLRRNCPKPTSGEHSLLPDIDESNARTC
jgi:hypothetical protein